MSPSKFLLIKDSFLNSVIQSFKTTILKAKTLKNIEGIIVGKAIYDGDISLFELALELEN